MPRIDPMKLLVCLSVLLAPNGGIRNAGEVRRLANLMAKFSKKLVSKAIYIQILKCTETELLGQFMQTGGWSLVHMWLVDGIGSKNWPLIQELMELLLCCPVDVERLKINSTPRLVKSLSTDSANESVKVLASKLVEQWLYIVKAPKQLSPMVPINQSELPAITGLAVGAAAEGKLLASSDGVTANATTVGVTTVGKQGEANEQHLQHNGYGPAADEPAATEVKEESEHDSKEDMVDGKKTFQTAVGGDHASAVQPKKTSLVLKITTKNGKQVVAKVIKPTVRKNQRTSATAHGQEEQHEDEEEDDEDEEDQEEVVVNIESSKPSGGDETTVAAKDDQQQQQQQEGSEKKKEADVQNGIEGSKERNSSTSKDKDRHNHSHRDREKDRKGSSSGSSRSSTSKSSSSSSSSSSKHKSSSCSSSSSKNSSSSSSRSKDKERHGSSSSSSSKHKSSSSSSSTKSSSSSSKSGSSSSSSDKHRDKEKSSSSSGSRDGKDSGKNQQLARHSSRDDSVGGSNDSGSETSSVANTSDRKVEKSSSTTIPSKKASISIEVRNPEHRVKTVKTYNSQFRSHGLIEEAPPPPSRKGLKKPSSTTAGGSPSTTSANNTSSTVIGSTAIGTVKRSSPVSTARDAALAGVSAEKRAKEDPTERPGSIKLIPPKRQHALVESDMFMDALSATLKKDTKKRKRRTSGSEGSATSAAAAPIANSKAAETTTTNTTGAGAKSAGSDAGKTSKTNAPASPPAAAAATEDNATEASAPTTPTSPKVPTIAPMSFYRDTLAEQEEENATDATAAEDGTKKDEANDESGSNGGAEEKKLTPAGEKDGEEDDEDEPIVKKPKRAKCELNDDDDETKSGESGEEKKVKKEEDDKTELMEVVVSEVEKKIAEEAGEGGDVKKEEGADKEEDGKKPPGPGCGPDGPPGVLVIHRRKGPKKQLRWRVAEELEEVRYFELDVTERCNVTKSFTDMKQMERVDERQKFMLSRKVGSEDIMVERTVWRPLLVVDNVPPSPDGSQSVERNVQRQRERGCLQALYFNKHMIPDSPVEPDPADTYQTADPVHIPLEDVTGNPDSVNDFTSVPWPDPRSTPPHDSAAFNSPFFPSDLPPGGVGFGPGGGFPPPFAPGAAATIGPGPWNLGPPGVGGPAAGAPRPGVLPPGMFPLSQPPPGLGQPAAPGGGGSPNILNLPLSMSPNVPPPGMFPGANNFNAPPPELSLMAGGRRADDFRVGPPPHQQWTTSGSNRPFGNNPARGGGFGNRGGGGGGGNWNNRNNMNGNNNGNRTGDRGRLGDDGRGNFRGHWLQGGNRGHNNNNNNNSNNRGGRKW